MLKFFIFSVIIFNWAYFFNHFENDIWKKWKSTIFKKKKYYSYLIIVKLIVNI